MTVCLNLLPSLNRALPVICGGKLLPSVISVYILRIVIILSQKCYFSAGNSVTSIYILRKGICLSQKCYFQAGNIVISIYILRIGILLSQKCCFWAGKGTWPCTWHQASKWYQTNDKTALVSEMCFKFGKKRVLFLKKFILKNNFFEMSFL